MGFMDKAKQMAEQAQQKIEETQKQFNQNQAEKGAANQGAGGGPVRYDDNGRPIGEAPPAAGVPAASVEPAVPLPGSDAGQPPASDPATAEAVSVPQPPEGLDASEGGSQDVTEEPVPPPAPPKDGVNATPDPFKPIR
ncbi:hypothetical protein BH20ACT20_BH20ACT20_00160 [soil metagenome]